MIKLYLHKLAFTETRT